MGSGGSTPRGARAPAPALPLPSALETVYLSRQAIYDASLNSRAYELHYRSASGRATLDADRASCSVLLSAFAELGLERVAANKRVFLNISHDVLSGALALPVKPAQAVLQVRDYEHSVDELLVGLRQRRAEGYEIALDGFVCTPANRPLIELADYLKFDIGRLGVAGLNEQLGFVGDRPCATVATRIDSSEQFAACVAAGCDYFQGRFLFRPQLLSHKRLPKNLETLVQLLRRLRDPDVGFPEIEGLVKTDPGLVVALLRVLASAAYAPPQPVTGVLQAITLLGLREFSKWVTVVALTSTAQRPPEVSLVALVRARACELIAEALGQDAESAFTAGLVSALEMLFERPLASLLDELPLSAEIRDAVLGHIGPLGRIIEEVSSREHDEAPRSTRFETGTINRAWLEALSWAADAQRALG
jgi:EAL and modified HD-GYP domain-containing signal transduction protein